MEQILGTLALVALCNTAVIQILKWLFSKADVTLTGAWLIAFSWGTPVLGALVAKWTGYYEMSVFGALLAGGLIAATSNKVFDVFAWLRGQAQSV